MDFNNNLISDTLEHRGCGIKAASYEVSPASWLPEACVWLHTGSGQRKLWVRSFAHCFAAEQLTFPNRLDADSWALVAAKTIIDRALEQLNLPTGASLARSDAPITGVWRMARHSVSALGNLNPFRFRH
jgi:hypothetical protein